MRKSLSDLIEEAYRLHVADGVDVSVAADKVADPKAMVPADVRQAVSIAVSTAVHNRLSQDRIRVSRQRYDRERGEVAARVRAEVMERVEYMGRTLNKMDVDQMRKRRGVDESLTTNAAVRVRYWDAAIEACETNKKRTVAALPRETREALMALALKAWG